MVFFMYPPDLGGGTGKNTPPAGSASPFWASQGQSRLIEAIDSFLPCYIGRRKRTRLRPFYGLRPKSDFESHRVPLNILII